MRCVLCENSNLQRELIDENLDGYVCKECGGIWIQAKAYWKWLKARLDNNPNRNVIEAYLK